MVNCDRDESWMLDCGDSEVVDDDETDDDEAEDEDEDEDEGDDDSNRLRVYSDE